MENVVTLGLPKGSLEESTLALFARAGFTFHGSERSLWLSSNSAEIKPVLIRAQEIPRYVANGSLDCGLSGLDWIRETECEEHIITLADLHYSKRTFRPVKWVLAVANDSPVRVPEDLKKLSGTPRIATELKNLTENWLAERGIIADVEFSWGATEAKVPFFADAIVECTETGASMTANNLRIIGTVFESTTKFFGNKEVLRKDPWKRNKLESIALLLKSCLAADMKVIIHVEVPKANSSAVKAVIPSEASFSVWNGQSAYVLIDIVVDRLLSRDIVPALARNGAKRITVSSLGMLYEEDSNVLG